MLVYLDNCTLNRPFDDQRSVRIKIETDAKLHLQELVRLGSIRLAWSYILEYENAANPFPDKRRSIAGWHALAAVSTRQTAAIVRRGQALCRAGVAVKDALHVACAIALQCDYFVTTDDDLLRRSGSVTGVKVVNPTDLVRILEQQP